MSITKGAMLISNANAVGSELVNKLGGTGYKPVEWADAINLLGISNDDKASALASITEGTYTGDERGSIKYNNCNAVGSMLNKKFSTDRGFKPVEWESAISKLTPLAERTVSGAICNIVNGAEDVPLKSWEVEIAPTLTGKSAIECTQTGRNLFNYEAVEALNANVIITRNDGDYTVQNNNSYGVGAFRGISFHLKPSSYSLSLGEALSVPIRIYKNGSWFNNGINAGGTSCTFTVTEEANYDFSCNVSANSSLTIKKCQFEVGSTATAYEPYVAPTTYTAQLGRTIYGGTADIVNGVGTDGYAKIIFNAENKDGWQLSNTIFYYDVSANSYQKNIDATNYTCDILTPVKQAINISDMLSRSDNSIALYGNTPNYWRVFIKKSDITTLEAFKTWISSNNVTFVYELATPTDFTFTPITPTPETALGTNNFWADEGDSEVTYRKDPDIPDPPVQVIDMNNNENNDN